MYTGVTPTRLPDKIPTALETNPHACFALTESLEFSYCNPAWDRFALENQGSPAVLAKDVLRKSFLEFVPELLKEHYAGLFQLARATGRMQSQDYECSSAQKFRIYRMQAYPLQKGLGFLVVNSLRVEREHTCEAHGPDDATYRDKTGLICMCANCRRSRRVDDPAIWDWVSDHVRTVRADLTHSVCPFCREYYYGAYVPPAAE
jgi:hypothetical protein